MGRPACVVWSCSIVWLCWVHVSIAKSSTIHRSVHSSVTDKYVLYDNSLTWLHAPSFTKPVIRMHRIQQVFLRVRGGADVPPPGVERCVEPSLEHDHAVVTRTGLTWHFDGVFDEHATQHAVYERVAREFVPSIFEGKSASIMCYGQTGSGKTHSMIGPARVCLLVHLCTCCRDWGVAACV